MATTRTTTGSPAYEGPAGTVSAARATTPARMAFLRKTYTLFSLAMVLWMGTAATIISSDSLLNSVMGLFGGSWIGMAVYLIGAFVLLRVTASKFPLNLIGLSLFAVFMGAFTAPMVAMYLGLEGGVGIVLQAFLLTACVFGAITAYVLTTKKDFSFMRGALAIGIGLAFGMVLLAMFGNGWAGGIVMGTGWSVAMVLLFGGFMLYDTSKVLHRYPTNMAATAAAMLFYDFVIMFLHMLRLVAASRD
jgi:FtsH-binding integral membrane protein